MPNNPTDLAQHNPVGVSEEGDFVAESVWRSLQNDVQVRLVHKNALPAEVFIPSLTKSG